MALQAAGVDLAPLVVGVDFASQAAGDNLVPQVAGADLPPQAAGDGLAPQTIDDLGSAQRSEKTTTVPITIVPPIRKAGDPKARQTKRRVKTSIVTLSPKQRELELTKKANNRPGGATTEHEQAGFCRGRSTVDEITLLTKDIEDSFQVNEKAGVVLLDLTATYDTVWLRGLHLTLLKTAPDKHLVSITMEILTNSDAQQNRLRRLKNGVSQDSVLAPLLFNI